MMFQSILFENPEDPITHEPSEAPDCFSDLNLDQIIDAITAGKQEYTLQPIFSMPLRSIEAVLYRQEIMRDLEQRSLFEQFTAFAQQLRTMRTHLTQAGKLYYKYQKERWFLDAVDLYCDAVTNLVHDLSLAEVQSRGLLAFRSYVTDYAHSDYFTALRTETKQLKADLSSVHYVVLIQGNRVTVRKYASERDYSADVAETFEKFKQGAVKDYRVNLSSWPDMNHVEAHVLELVAKLYPEVFAHLDAYCMNYRTYLDETLARFDREIQFYLASLEYVARFKRAGLPCCYPLLATTGNDIYAYEAFDAALAGKLLAEKSQVVCNDFSLNGQKRILVITGPNQGGKTTFARAFGQIHYLASLGCPVPAREARLLLPDRLLTHFEKEEAIKDLRSKLEDDLVRMSHILSQATAQSLIIFNEIFTSTTISDAVFLSKEVMKKLTQVGVLGVWVTFIDELASFSEQTVSMVSTVVPDNPALRTFKIVKKPADGLAYALAIAEKYRLTYERIKERISS